MASGKASFTNLDFYVPKDGSAVITVLADINTIENGAESGAIFRLGLNEQSGMANNSFEGQGEGSNEKKTATSLSTYTNSTAVKTMVVRKTMPAVAKSFNASTKLNNGTNDIATVTVTADAKGSVSFKRLIFQFNSSAMDINSLELLRKIGSGPESSITNQVSIKNKFGANLKTGGANLASNGNGSVIDKIYITWDNLETSEEYISAGTTNTYILRANVAYATANKFSATYIADDNSYVTTDAQNLLKDDTVNFIWSDNSAKNHSTYTNDWTNVTDIPSLPTQTLSLSF